VWECGESILAIGTRAGSQEAAARSGARRSRRGTGEGSVEQRRLKLVWST
jgi:hypothetical protein